MQDYQEQRFQSLLRGVSAYGRALQKGRRGDEEVRQETMRYRSRENE